MATRTSTHGKFSTTAAPLSGASLLRTAAAESGAGTPLTLNLYRAGEGRTQRMLWLLSALFVAAVLAVCNASVAAAAEGLTTLRVGVVVPWIGHAPLHIAQAKGYFKDAALRVEFVRVEEKAGASLVAAATNRVDVGLGTLDELPIYWRPESPVVGVLVLDESSGGDGMLVRKDRNINSISDLKGKTIALWFTTPSHFLLNYLLIQNGMSEADVELVDMAADEAAQALIEGKVDAAVTWNPHLPDALKNPNVKLLVTSEATPGLLCDVAVFRKDVLATRPDAVRRFIRAWNRGVTYQRTNPDDAALIIANAMGYERVEDVKADLAGIRLYGREENRKFFSGRGPGTAVGTQKFAIELWTDLGRVAAPVAAADLLDGAYLEK